MADEIVTSDNGAPHTTVIERSGGGMGTVLIAMVLLIAVLAGAWFLFNQNQAENRKTDAITRAADKVGEGAQKVGDSAQKAADKTTE